MALRFPLLMAAVGACLLACPAPADPEGGPPADAGPPEPTPDAGADAGSPDAGGEAPETAQERLARLLTGTFDSAAQAQQDPSYFAVSLKVCPIPLAAFGAHVLYVEQALVGSAPYRQRMYVIEPGADEAEAVSVVYELADPGSVVGLCDGTASGTVGLADPIARPGCEVRVTWDGTSFSGGTTGQGCSSDLNGASYATSEVVIHEAGVSSWDRGFDASGNQVWGAVDGPYRFDRTDPED